MRHVRILLEREIRTEFRNKQAISGVMLYIITTIFVCYQAFRSMPDAVTWNTLFWIILLFASLHAISKSFFSETSGRHLYLYTLISPSTLILTKLIYNMVLMGLVALISLFFFSLFLGNEPLQGANLSLYALTVALGCMGFSGIFTLIAAIAARTSNNLGIMAVLGFPIIIPLLITLITLSDIALRGLPWSFGAGYAGMLLGMNALVITLSYLLFSYLWRD